MATNTLIIHFTCPDQEGILAKITGYLAASRGNIVEVDQHSTKPEGGQFFLRIVCSFKEPVAKDLQLGLDKEMREFKGELRFFDSERRLRMGILVSKPSHCLSDLLYRYGAGQLEVDIPAIISNHADHEKLARFHEIDYIQLSVTPSDKGEKQILDALVTQTDFIVMARYMQILSPDFLRLYQKDIINIHHSFLPSFKGANPYGQAFDRGVKVIGATAHFATASLDEGPIIAQKVESVSHRDDATTLKQKGEDIERLTLWHAIQAYTQHRILRYQNKTIVFGE